MSLPVHLFGFSCSEICGNAGLGYDIFRSVPEGDWEGNTGVYASFNVAFATSSGAAVQFGGSYGFYDWNGRLSSPSDKEKVAQQQLFLTPAIVKTTPCPSGFNYGIAYDWMWNKGFGVFGVETDLSQLRFQVGYLKCYRNEFGFWGTTDLGSSHASTFGLPLTFRAISQVNAFWRHIFCNCAETKVWVGLPYKRSLAFSSGLAGKWIAGVSFHAPLSNRLSIDGHGSYMHPHSAPGATTQRYYAANVCIELKYAFGNCCSCKTPYMSIGNNSNFITDTDITF